MKLVKKRALYLTTLIVLILSMVSPNLNFITVESLNAIEDNSVHITNVNVNKTNKTAQATIVNDSSNIIENIVVYAVTYKNKRMDQ